jgi:purine-nucleoside phosphorylase
VITPETLYDLAAARAAMARRRRAAPPEVAIILGTGLGGLAREIDVEQSIPYSDLPDFPLSTVESHTGRLLLGRLSGRPVVAMQGRFHYYEGYSPAQITYPVRVMKLLGARTLLASNAAGGLNPGYRKGDLMILADHINLLGVNPLMGKNDDRFGPRFPDMSQPYSVRLVETAQSLALGAGLRVQTGVYVAVGGPNLETRAEYRMLRAIGADCVGMSTVPEVIVGRHMGMECFAVSCVTDMCLPDALEEAKLEDILAVAADAEPRLTRLLALVVANVGSPQPPPAASTASGRGASRAPATAPGGRVHGVRTTGGRKR